MKLFAITALGVGLASSAPAFAVVDFQVMGGARTAKVDYKVNDEEREKDVKSTEIGVAAHVSPGKLPVAFGVFGNMNKYDTTPIVEEQLDEETSGTTMTFADPSSSISGMTYGPELVAWVPIPMFKPYLRAGYVMGSYDYKNKAAYEIGQAEGEIEQTLTYKTTGYNVGVGFIYSPVPVLGLVVEYNIGSEKLTATKGKVKSSTTFGSTTTDKEDAIKIEDLEDDDKEKDFGSSAIRLGLSLSL